MIPVRAILACALATPVLSGCVAAAALPVLAAGGIVSKRSDTPPTSSPASPRVALPADAEQAQVARTSTSATAPEPAPSPSSGATSRTITIAEFERATLSAPTPGSGAGGYAAFADFARAKAAVPTVGTERSSALLADPASMQAKTRTCSIHPAAVLIDVDPAGATVDPSRPLTADGDLATRLGDLRADGVTIGWVSARTADRAGDLRRVLRSTGLDPAGRDELVLLRFPEERKQTRRDDFAKAYCLVALAGDERADFDELFGYLRDPSMALSLESLIGNGWFLVPTPLQ